MYICLKNEMMLNCGVMFVGQEMVPLHLVVEIPCLLQTEVPHEVPLNHGEAPLPQTGNVIVNFIIKLLGSL